MNKIVLFLVTIVILNSCDTYLAPYDDTTYKEMVNYGVSYIESGNLNSNVLVLDTGYQLEASTVSHSVVNETDWHLEETIKINNSQYHSYFSTNNKSVALNLVD